MDVNLWTYLHDGLLSDFAEFPPDIVITVEIPHLRRLWRGQGCCLKVTLRDCNQLAWDSYSTPQDVTTTNMSEVAALMPAILQVQQDDYGLVLNTELGDLLMKYDYADIHLDTDEPVTLDDLRQKSDMYWSRRR